jgi:hypothetical protein
LFVLLGGRSARASGWLNLKLATRLPCTPSISRVQESLQPVADVMSLPIQI